MSERSWLRHYPKIPIWVQNIACSIGGWRFRRERYGRAFWEALAFLEKSQWWSLQEQIEYQNEQLRRVIACAFQNVPYYREIFDERRLKPDDIRTRDDLVKLPILTKRTVRAGQPTCSRGRSPRAGWRTGTRAARPARRCRLRAERETAQWQWAVWWRHRRRFGVDVHEPYITFAGRSGVVPLAGMDPPFWRRNLPLHQTFVSVHHMTRQNLPALADYLQTRKVSYYSGYPSGLYLLATYLLDNGIHLRCPPRVVFTGAETVLPHQRVAIEKALDTEVADQYGSAESVGNISECRRHLYHVDMEFGVIEFEPSPNLSTPQRRVIATGLHNLAMPLIRYETGDMVTMGDQPCRCGRQASVIEQVDGRIESYIVTPDGRQLGRLDHLFKDSHAILEAQLLQDRVDHVLVKVVKAQGYDQEVERKFLAEMRAYMGSQIQVEIQYVDEIPREANGKFRQVVSNVFQDKYADVFQTDSQRCTR